MQKITTCHKHYKVITSIKYLHMFSTPKLGAGTKYLS